MNYAEIKYYDVANGPGVRTSLFVSGCTHRCEGCFNEIAWDFNYGMEFTQETINDIIRSLEPAYITGLTILGGEPLDPANQPEVLKLLEQVRQTLPDISIWCFTGYIFDRDLIGGSVDIPTVTRRLLSLIDVIVDGPFILSRKNMLLKFKGSDNQRTILVKESLDAGEVVLHPAYN